MEDQKPAPVFDVVLGAFGVDCVVKVNGQDITKYLSAISVESRAGAATKVALTVCPGAARVIVQGAIEAVEVKP